MTEQEFVKTCVLCGYASKKNASIYAEGRDELTEADLEAVFRLNERGNDIKNLALKYSKCRSSGDHLLDELSKKPTPWNHVFNASRGGDA